jgi:hypothetical protein
MFPKCRSYLVEFEAEFKKALARESGPGLLFDEKPEGRKVHFGTVEEFLTVAFGKKKYKQLILPF